jgi:hypothetical protein
MCLGERAPPVRRRFHPDHPDCEATRAGLGAYLGSGAYLRERPELFAHLQVCATCHAHYAEALVVAARLGRALRTKCEPGLARPAPGDTPARTRSSLWIAPERARNWRRMLLPALILLCLSRFEVLGAGARLEALAGQVFVDASALRPADGPRRLARGARCAIADDARARLRAGAADLDLHAGTSLFVEDPRAPRFRLEHGALLATGACRITSSYGVVDVESGAAFVSADERALTVSARGGRVLASNALQRHALEGLDRIVLPAQP